MDEFLEELQDSIADVQQQQQQQSHSHLLTAARTETDEGVDDESMDEDDDQWLESGGEEEEDDFLPQATTIIRATSPLPPPATAIAAVAPTVRWGETDGIIDPDASDTEEEEAEGRGLGGRTQEDVFKTCKAPHLVRILKQPPSSSSVSTSHHLEEEKDDHNHSFDTFMQEQVASVPFLSCIAEAYVEDPKQQIAQQIQSITKQWKEVKFPLYMIILTRLILVLTCLYLLCSWMIDI